MKKVLVYISIFSIVILGLTGCNNSDSIKFKNDYEQLNGEINISGKEHRTILINKNNPFVYSTPEDIVKKIENKETFYVYFGSPYCPWCRSVLEKAIEVANSKNIKKIYYIDIWDDNYTELLRDVVKINEQNEIETVKEGTKAYNKLLKYFNNLLSDYTLTDNDGNKISVGEKRIYAPNFIYVENGKAVKLTTGISDEQDDSRQELTEELLNDEEEQFKEFFNNESNTCDKDSKC